jgi:tetratricopeptide (TPR) repeat protein
MSAPLKDNNREVIPRWRDLRSTIVHGELTPPLSHEPLVAVPVGLLEDKIQDWKSEGSLPYATEVVGASLVLGHLADAREAAEYIILHSAEASTSAVNMARRALSTRPEKPEGLNVGRDSFSATVREMKALVRTDPRNALAWVELARAYTSLGLKERAAKAIHPALTFGSNNRHILRSAARLYSHLADPARAHSILSRAERTPFDPWLIATEIGTAGLSDKPPKFVREGLKLLTSKSVSPFDLTELASALATLDSKAGNHRRARKHFRLSLEHPNDNAVAQARWAATHKFIDLNPDSLKLPAAFEARAWYAFYAGEWKAALSAGKCWLGDQPFSASPAVHASYVAAVSLEHYEEAVEIVQAGLLANPHNSILLNNLSFSLASLGRLKEAAAWLKRIDRPSLSSESTISVNATAGLIAYRAGDSEMGRRLYKSAISTAELIGERRLEAKATVFFALEELRAESESATGIAERALHLASEFQDSDFDLLRGRLERSIRERRGRGQIASS